MIEKTDLYKFSQYNNPLLKNNPQKPSRASFGNGLNILTMGLQACEQHPMIGVSVIDGATCIAPRAAVDFHTNPHAGLETFRRESSGLFVNCLLPSFFVYGIGKLIQHSSLPKEYRGLNMAESWANQNSIEKLSSYFPKSGEQNARVKSYVNDVLNALEGFNSSENGGWVPYSKDKKVFNNVSDLLTDAILNKSSKKDIKETLKNAYKQLVSVTNASDTIRFRSDQSAFDSNLSALLRDTVDMGKKFSHASVINNIDHFKDALIKFVNKKSLVGLAVILPLASSMQYINRWITRKQSGVEGAPIYRDFGTETKIPKGKDNKLWMYKVLGAGSIMGLAVLSMMKKPSLKMLQFKGWFPTLDQARWIAAITFASRVLAAEDRNEVRESTFRDAAGFASLYFLGDYVAKAVATIMHRVNPKYDLINKHKVLDKDAGIIKKFGNWVKNQGLKSFDEVRPDMKNARAFCQAASLGASMLILGLFIPIWNRKRTEKNRAQELKNIELQKQFTETIDDKLLKTKVFDEIKNNKVKEDTALNPELSPLEYGPESTMSLLWHKLFPSSSTFCGFEKMSNFK